MRFRARFSSPAATARGPLRATAASVVVAGPLFAAGAAPADAATTYSAPPRTAVMALPVAAESGSGYDRAEPARQ